MSASTAARRRAIAAAVIARRLGRSVTVAAFGRHLGGMSASGLGATDTGRIDAIGGLSREFYRRVGRARTGSTESFALRAARRRGGVRGVGRASTASTSSASSGSSPWSRAATASSSCGWRAAGASARAMFVDASYEGDLMARAGVTWTAGREGNDVYGETLNGVQLHETHQFRAPVDPYVIPGDPSTGLLAGVWPGEPGTPGAGDRSIQAYNFRLCLTRAPDRLPFPKPPGLRRGALRAAAPLHRGRACSRCSATTSRCRTARPTSTTTARSPPTTSVATTAGPTATTPSASGSSRTT